MRERRISRDDRRQDRREPELKSPPAPAAALLELQRRAGNRAVAGMLARDKDEPPPSERGTSTTMELGKLGVLALEYAHWGHTGQSVDVAFVDGPITAAFMQASAVGEPFETAWVSTPGVKSTMTSVVIASAHVGGQGAIALCSCSGA